MQSEGEVAEDSAVIGADKAEQWYFFRVDDAKWRWLKITAEGQRQMAKVGFASEEGARQAAGRVGFIGEGKVIRQPVSLTTFKNKIITI